MNKNFSELLNSPKPLKRLGYSVAEVAVMIGMEPSTVRREVIAGRIPSVQVSPRRKVIPASWIDERFPAQ